MQKSPNLIKKVFITRETTSLVFFMSAVPCPMSSEHWLCTATSGMTTAAKASFAQGKPPGTPITERK